MSRHRSWVLLALVPSLLGAGTIGVLIHLANAPGEQEQPLAKVSDLVLPAGGDIHTASIPGPSIAVDEAMRVRENETAIGPSVHEATVDVAPTPVEGNAELAQLPDISPFAGSDFSGELSWESDGSDSGAGFSAQLASLGPQRRSGHVGGMTHGSPKGETSAPSDAQSDTDEGARIVAPSIDEGTQGPPQTETDPATSKATEQPEEHIADANPPSEETQDYPPTQPPVQVPEPESLWLFILGSLGCLLSRRKRKA